MKVSTRGRYGLRAMVDLALYQESGAIPLREISERQEISEQYLEQLFANLRKAGFVKSVRGAYGGYLLNRSPEEITAGDIIRTLEGPVAPADCVLETETICKRVEECVVHELWNKVKESIDEVLNEVSLADLKEKAAKLHRKNDGGIMYHI